MAWYDNITQGDFEELLRRVYRLENRTTLNNTAIGRAGIEVYDGGIIRVTNGGLSVTGTAEIIGRLFASGFVNFTGEVAITGPLDVSGSMDVSGPLDVSGLVKLMSDLEVHSGGRIKAGSIELNPDGSAKFGSMSISPEGKISTGTAEINPDGSAKFGAMKIDANGKMTLGGMTLDPAALGGKLGFSNGSHVVATPNGAQLALPGGGAAYVSGSQAGIANGGVGVGVDGSGQFMPGMPTKSGVTPNVYIDPSSDRMYRIV